MVQHDWQPKASTDLCTNIDIAPPQTRRFNHDAGWTANYARTPNPDSTDIGTLRGAHEFVDRFTDGCQDRGDGLVRPCAAPQHSAQLHAVEHGRLEGGTANVDSNGGRCELLGFRLPLGRWGLGNADALGPAVGDPSFEHGGYRPKLRVHDDDVSAPVGC